ncbi:kappa-type opioid receptor-like [Diadema antillarum]|uniref:kappa-type opioid receptor-like n=1 Tax=Diadema antillarum TaxID=105358 RepID=UPI003A847C79
MALHEPFTAMTTGDADNLTEASDWQWTPVTWSAAMIVQLLLSILGIVGNAIVLIVLFQRRSSKRSTDILIGGLAAADFLTSIFMIPQPKLSGAPDTALGNAACKLIYSSIFLWITISASVFTLTAISIERYIAVLHPIQFKGWVSFKKLTVWFIIIWVLAIAINCRTFGTTKVDSVEGKCVVRYPTQASQQALGVFVFVLRFIIPVIIMLTSYLLIARSLRLRSQRLTKKSEIKLDTGSSVSRSFLVARGKVIKLMFVVIITFIICWTPDSLGLLAYNLHLVDRSYLYSSLYSVFVSLAFFNTCANPIIYTIRYAEFRSAVRDLLLCSESVKTSLFGKDSDTPDDSTPRLKRAAQVQTII